MAKAPALDVVAGAVALERKLQGLSLSSAVREDTRMEDGSLLPEGRGVGIRAGERPCGTLQHVWSLTPSGVDDHRRVEHEGGEPKRSTSAKALDLHEPAPCDGGPAGDAPLPARDPSASNPDMRPPPEFVNSNLLEEGGMDLAGMLGYQLEGLSRNASAHCGLTNVGNTCYINALLQVLSKSDLVCELAEQHLGSHEGPGAGRGRCVLCALAEDITKLNNRTRNYPFEPCVHRLSLSWNPQYRRGRQEDAQETFLLLFDALDYVDIAAARALGVNVSQGHCGDRVGFTSSVWRIFGSMVRSTSECEACGKQVIKYEMVQMFSLSFSPGPALTVEGLFAFHFQREALARDDRCADGCGVRGRRSRVMDVVSWPRVLVIHLKRWGAVNEFGEREKDTRIVSFGRLLNLGGHTYMLKGVVLHGGDFGGGHYTTYVRTGRGQWYLCDDSKETEEAEEASVLSAQDAYLLLYERLPEELPR